MGKRAVIVPASAGSGKTFRIAQEYIYDTLRDHTDSQGNRSFDPLFYKKILAVTFTNKATEEMKSRIVKDIHLLASGEECGHLKALIKETGLDEKELRSRAKVVRSAILHDYSHFTILTNDTFFQRVLRAFIRELNIDINFSTELDPTPIVLRAIDGVIDKIKSEPVLRKWIGDLAFEKIEQGDKWNVATHIKAMTHQISNESIRESIDSLRDKEAFLQRIERIIAYPDDIAQTLQKCATDALARIERSGFDRTLFKAFTPTLETISKSGPTTIRSNLLFVTLPQKDVSEWFKKRDSQNEALLQFARELAPLLREIRALNSRYKLAAASREYILKHYRSYALLYDIQLMVESLCRDENSMILSQTKHTISKLISEEDAPFIYEKVGNYFAKFMIDEFQDTSLKEWTNFLPLLRNAMAQSEDTSTLIVGDVKQSIYRWRGGDWRILGEQVAQDLGQENVSREPLKYNWRSLDNVVKFNNELYAKIVEIGNDLLNKKIKEARSKGLISEEAELRYIDTLSAAYADIEQITAKEDEPRRGYVDICFTPQPEKGEDKSDDDTATASHDDEPLNDAPKPYIERIRHLLADGYKPSDITILVRNNRDGITIAEELLEARSTFPEEDHFEITTEVALKLASSPATKLIISILRLSIDRENVGALTLYNHIAKGGNYSARLDEQEQKWLDTIRSMSPEEAFERITVRYANLLKGYTAYVQALHEEIVNFCANKCADIATFEKWWQEKGESASLRVERNERAIEIMTIHKAKGLDNKIIILPLCQWSMAPKSSSGNASGIFWAKLEDDDTLQDDTLYPISYNKEVVNSLFAESGYNEIVSVYVESVNLLYVATTRAAEQLYIFIENPKANTIGDLVSRAYLGRANKGEDGLLHYTKGNYESPQHDTEGKPKVTPVSLGEYTASEVELQLRTHHSRYFNEGATTPTQRTKGIKLHRAFERASTREDIVASIDSMAINGDISTEESRELKHNISQMLDNTIAGEWFDGSWEHIHNERNILQANNPTRRPDRVMTRGKEAVVVDYKFGHENDSYNDKMQTYMKLLRSMGYTSVKGYLWYIAEGKIRVTE